MPHPQASKPTLGLFGHSWSKALSLLVVTGSLWCTLHPLSAQAEPAPADATPNEGPAQVDVIVDASGHLVEEFVRRPVDKMGPICREILGTQIRGTGRTIGFTGATLIPNENSAIIDLAVSGTTYSKTRGYNGPVIIHSQGTTNFTSSARVHFDGSKFWAAPAVAMAQTHTKTCDIQAKVFLPFRGIVKSVARRRIQKTKAEAEYISSRQAEGTYAENVDETVGEKVASANRALEEKVRVPLRDRKLMPDSVMAFTTAEYLELAGVSGALDSAQASQARPPRHDTADLELRCHEKPINYFLSHLLAGKTIGQADVEKSFEEELGLVPERFQVESEARRDGKISFPEKDPVVVSFENNQVTITIHGDSYQVDNKTYGAMDVTARYQVQNGPNGFKLEREGELAIYPPGFVSGQGQRLGFRQQLLRKMLHKRFDRLFASEIDIKPLRLGDKNDSTAPLISPVVVTSDKGWLQLAFQLPSP